MRTAPNPGTAQSNVANGREQFEYLDKLIALYSWFPESLTTFQRLLAAPNDYSAIAEELENWLHLSTEDNPLPEAETELQKCGCDQLYLRAVALAPIFKLMKGHPLFSKAKTGPLSAFLRMADVKPSSGKSMLAARDAVFSRILSAVEEQGQITVNKLMIDDLTKLITLDRGFPELGKLLYEQETIEQWMDRLRAIEENVENTSVEAPPTTVALDEHSTKILEWLKKSGTEDPQLIRFFLSTPRFSSIVKQEVLLYLQIRDQLQRAKVQLNKNFESISGPDRYSRIAVIAVDILPQTEREAIETTLELQVQAALYFLELRKFAKLDALAFKWPELADILRADVNSFIRTYETPAGEAGTAGPESLSGLRDRNLREFLRSRPLFSGILDRELTEYFAVAQVVVKASDIQPSSMAPKPMTSAVKAEPGISGYEDVILRMEEVDGDKETFAFSVESKSGQSQAVSIELPSEEIQWLNSRVKDLFLYRSATREIFPQESDPMTTITEVGTALHNRVFNMDPSVPMDQKPETIFGAAVERALKANQRIRMVLEFKGGLPVLLPWEALYSPTWPVPSADRKSLFDGAATAEC